MWEDGGSQVGSESGRGIGGREVDIQTWTEENKKCREIF